MKFWKVTTRFFDSGKVDVAVEQQEGASMPDNTSAEKEKFDEYIDYFKTKREADAWAEDARNA
jgi:hypothetical protein